MGKTYFRENLTTKHKQNDKKNTGIFVFITYVTNNKDKSSNNIG